jgi:uncharacterized protein (TIGR02266 family)
MRIMLQDVLTEAGYDVVTAADGVEAWDLIHDAEGFDLLIIDLLMPRMTGFELLEKLHADTNNGKNKILVITGIFKSQKEIQRLKELGARGYITKTALVDEILFRVNQVFHCGNENTRRHPRFLKSLPVDYSAGKDQLFSYTSNFSAGGAFIRTISPSPVGEKLDVSLRIPDINLHVKAEARVAWTNEYETHGRKSCLPGMGIEFINLPPNVKTALQSFIQDQISKEPFWI